MGYVFRGMRFVYLEHPGLVRIWIFPILITVACLVFGLGELSDLASGLLDRVWDAPGSADGWAAAEGLARGVILFLVRLVLFAVGIFVLFALSSVIASPFNDALSEAVERLHAGTEAPPFTVRALLRDLVRTLLVESGKLMLYLGLVGPLFLVGLFVPAVAAVVGPLAFVLTALYLSLDYVDWPLARRNRPAGARLRLVRRHFAPLLGFGAGVWLCLYVPFVNLFFMPAAVAGGRSSTWISRRGATAPSNERAPRTSQRAFGSRAMMPLGTVGPGTKWCPRASAPYDSAPDGRPVMNASNSTRRSTLLASAALLALAVGAEAQGGASAPLSDGIATELGEVRWGWSEAQLVSHFEAQIRERYRRPLQTARDALQEDALRQRMADEIRRLRESRYAFNGRASGHDSGFLRDEFTHNNGESMLRVRGENTEDFYFFIRGRLWKWYRAFDARVFEGADFAQFREALEGRFGASRLRRGQLHEAADEREWIEWRDRETRLRAIDNTTFYGFYCLVFESRDTLRRLPQLRRNRPRRREGAHPLVERVTRDGSEVRGEGRHEDIVDRITGNDRRATASEDED